VNRNTIDLWVRIFVAIARRHPLSRPQGRQSRHFRRPPGYRLEAAFDNIGGLKRAPVKAAGVVVGASIGSASTEGHGRS
jgi:hypothetical protein